MRLCVLLILALTVFSVIPAKAELLAYWSYTGTRIGISVPDQFGQHFASPTLSCESARHLYIYDVIESAGLKTGDPYSISLFADEVEFRFSGRLRWRTPTPPNLDLVLDTSLDARNAAKLFQILPPARQIFISFNGGHRHALPTTHAGKAMNKLAAKCGFQQNRAFSLQRALIWTGFFDEIPTGRFDAQTQRAISAWRRNRGLAFTGQLSRSEETQLIGEGNKVANEFGWKLYSADSHIFEFYYPSAMFGSPRQTEGESDSRFELHFERLHAEDSASAYRDHLSELTRSGPKRQVTVISRTSVWSVIASSENNATWFTHIERRNRGIVMLRLKTPIGADIPRIWSRIFLLMSESLIIGSAVFE
jgi:peptidoglycan hydrolase-like protein with peptidoglycan-binding domain